MQPAIIPDEIISEKIYLIRQQKVMLDSDLAQLYDVETRVINQAVRRNAERFPEDFMFRLTDDEWTSLTSQIVISKAQIDKTERGGRRTLPYVFTEHGVLMLSSVLSSKRAIAVNIQVMRIFTRLRQMLQDSAEMREDIMRIQRELEKQGKSISLVFSYLDSLIQENDTPPARKRIGYKPDNL